MRITLLTLLLATIAPPLLAKEPPYGVRNLNTDAHINGPTLKADDLTGKLVVVEIWGIGCPPCRASLRGMGELARKYKKDKRVVIIGSHCQGLDKEALVDLLNQNKCEYPVYQNFATDAEPQISGIPHVYITNPKGECVWNGHPKNLEENLEKLVKAMPKTVGGVGSLIEGIPLKAFKSSAPQLMVGKNAERALQQIKTRAAKNPAFQEEADAIINACEAWAENTEKTINDAIETLPSLAIVAYQDLAKTFPSRAREYKDTFAPMLKDKKNAVAVRSRTALFKAKQQPTDTASNRKRLLPTVKMQKQTIDNLIKTAPEDGVSDDLLDLQKQWDELFNELSVSK